MRTSFIIVFVALGCAPVHDEPVAKAATPAASAPSTAAKPEPDVIDDPAPVDSFAWRWVVHADDQEFPQVREVHTDDNIRYQFLVDKDGDHVQVTRTGSKGRQDWSFAPPEAPMSGGFLLLDGELLLVAHHSHIATGTTVHALEAQTGEVRWSTDVVGLGPVSHSKYRNRVQLGVAGTAVVVYGFEAQGRYVEALDPKTGAMIGNQKIDDALATIPWRFELGDHEWPASTDGRAKASSTLGDTTFEVHYHAISSGAVLSASGPSTNWRVHLEGLGPIAHSQYRNAVEVRAEPSMVVVYGRESAGRYIEARSPQDGRLLSNLRFF